MGFAHRAFEKDQHRLDQIVDCESGFQIVVDRLGAELVGIARRRANADSIEVRFSFENQEPERKAHLSFGLHPGFAVSSIEKARIILPKGSYRRHLAPENFLSGETLEFESNGGTWPVKPFELPGSFLLEPVDIEQNVVILRDYEDRRQVEIDIGETPYLTIWSDLNPFICIEPCWGLPDHRDQRPFEKKLGIQVIEPGGTLESRFSMRFN